MIKKIFSKIKKYLIPSIIGTIGSFLFVVTIGLMPKGLYLIPVFAYMCFAMTTVILLKIWELDEFKKKLEEDESK